MRILMIGDGLVLTTGFAQVLRRCAAAFVAQGWDVHQLACLDPPPAFRSTPYERLGVTPWCVRNDITGFGVLAEVLERCEPDVLFFNGDPATVSNYFAYLDTLAKVPPTVAYMPIEGAPVIEGNMLPFQQATVALTYTKWSSERLRDEHGLDVPWVWHGVDSDVFQPLTEGRRRELRRLLGWEGKFVIGYVARNAWRKSQDRLITALRLLRDGNGDAIAPADDYHLYLHCQPWDNNQLGGWDLAFLRHCNGVTEQVQFAPDRPAVQGEAQIGLAQKLACLDVYVHPAKVEGFGLPLLEAMATGLPVIVTADGGNMEEVVGDSACAKVPPRDWDTWFNGARLANVSPADLAFCIDRVRHDRRMREAAGARARTRAQQFSWDTMAARLVLAVQQALGDEPVPADEPGILSFAGAL